MAGHYLQTVNPEAAAAIGQERSGELPQVGDWVIYFPRPGDMPGGTDRFPMVVMRIEPGGIVHGLVTAGLNDEREVRASRRSPQQPMACWDFRAGAAPVNVPASVAEDHVEDLIADIDLLRNKLNEVIAQANDLEEKVEALNRLEIPLTSFAGVGARLDRLEKELGLEDKPKPQPVASPPPRAAHKPAAKSKRKARR